MRENRARIGSDIYVPLLQSRPYFLNGLIHIRHSFFKDICFHVMSVVLLSSNMRQSHGHEKHDYKF